MKIFFWSVNKLKWIHIDKTRYYLFTLFIKKSRDIIYSLYLSKKNRDINIIFSLDIYITSCCIWANKSEKTYLQIYIWDFLQKANQHFNLIRMIFLNQRNVTLFLQTRAYYAFLQNIVQSLFEFLTLQCFQLFYRCFRFRFELWT